MLDATAFGAPGFVRIAYTVDEPELARACARIRRFVDGLQARRASA